MVRAAGWSLDDRHGIQSEMFAEKPKTRSFDGFTIDEGEVLSLLKNKGTSHVDEISWQTGMHLNKLASLLLNLEFQGMVRSLPGKKYTLI